MKLIPFLRFREKRDEEESDPLDTLVDDVPELAADEETEEEEEEEKQEEEEEKPPEADNEKSWGDEDEMLKVFMAVEEEFVDNSGLTSDMDEVSATELAAELRVLASAFGIDVVAVEEEAV